MRAVAKVVLAVVLLTAAAWAALAVALRVPAVRVQIATRIGALLSDERRTVSISSLGGSLPLAPTVGVLEIADSGGPWLRIENLAIEIDARPLLLRHVHLRAASADRVVLTRLPEPDEEPFVLKPLRLLVTAKRIEARVVELGEALLSAEGGAELAAPIAAEARGWVDLRRLTLAVDLSASTPRLDELLRAAKTETPITTGAARLHVNANGAIVTPGGRMQLSIADVRQGEVSVAGLELSAEAERLGMGDRRYRVDLAARTRDLSAPPALAPWLGGAPGLDAVVRFGATPKAFDVDALTIETATFGAELVGRGDEDGGVEISQIAVTWPDLRSVPELSSSVAGGALRVRGSAKVEDAWTAPDVDAKLSAEGIDLDWVEADARRLLGATPKLTARLRYDRERGPAAEDVQLSAGAFRAAARATVSSQGRAVVSADVEVPDVAVLTVAEPPLAGAAGAALAFDGTLDAFDATATLRSQGVRIGAAEPLSGDVVITAHRDRGTVVGDATARLGFGPQPVSAAGRYAYDVERGLVRVDGLTASLPGIDAEASGEV